MVSELKQMMAEELSARYGEGLDYLVVGWTGLGGTETTELRRKLREGRVRIEVVKNSIARRVLDENGLGEGAPFVDGPSALVTGECEMPVVCRLIKDLSKTYEEKLFVRGGMFDGEVLDGPAVNRLAEIPPLPVLHGQIAGGIYSALAGVASAFESVARSLACALEGIRKQKEEKGG
jgi:large subunit ribosomal protein L10